MHTMRKHLKNISNNRHNRNKNICALAVAQALEVDKSVRYLHTMSDIVRAARTKYAVRSRLSTVKGNTVGAIRKELSEKVDALAFIVRVDNHVMLLDCDGNTIVDTDPRIKDKRKVTHVYAVFNKTEFDLRINKNKSIKIQKIS